MALAALKARLGGRPEKRMSSRARESEKERKSAKALKLFRYDFKIKIKLLDAINLRIRKLRPLIEAVGAQLFDQNIEKELRLFHAHCDEFLGLIETEAKYTEGRLKSLLMKEKLTVGDNIMRSVSDLLHMYTLVAKGEKKLYKGFFKDFEKEFKDLESFCAKLAVFLDDEKKLLKP